MTRTILNPIRMRNDQSPEAARAWKEGRAYVRAAHKQGIQVGEVSSMLVANCGREVSQSE